MSPPLIYPLYPHAYMYMKELIKHAYTLLCPFSLLLYLLSLLLSFFLFLPLLTKGKITSFYQKLAC